ncbi:MAG TPA: glycoside hydrolase family 2, partial [Terracidiphilus sp.]|nr:glycoside hydrolase family 2 [Terracidiphilus sp.]
MPVMLFAASAPAPLPAPLVLAHGWQLQDAAKVAQSGAEVSSAAFNPAGWYPATVPGTALTTLVNNHVYPEPLYGENNRPEIVPDSLARTYWWYRTAVDVPEAYKGRHIWLNFDGINYAAQVWVNGAQVGYMRGAFIRGNFDITAQVKPGKPAIVAVILAPQPHPGVPHEHTLRAGMGLNGGESAIDGPTFLSTIGWDWIPAIRDRDTGIWQKVTLSSSDSVLVRDPLVTTDLPLPRTDFADVAVQATIQNITGKPVKGILHGAIENIAFDRAVELAPHSAKKFTFDRANTPALHIHHPRLWWPNGYGAPSLYTLHLSFETNKTISDQQDVSFGIRKISYSVPGADT